MIKLLHLSCKITKFARFLLSILSICPYMSVVYGGPGGSALVAHVPHQLPAVPVGPTRAHRHEKSSYLMTPWTSVLRKQ